MALFAVLVVEDNNGYLLGVIGLSFTFVEPFDIEKPVLEKSLILAFKIGCGLFIKDINSEGFGNVVFFRELGLKLISGRKDSFVFYNFSTLSIFSTFSNFSLGSYTEDFFFNLVTSKPPPVISYFLAFRYCSYLNFAYYCYLICFLSAY